MKKISVYFTSREDLEIYDFVKSAAEATRLSASHVVVDLLRIQWNATKQAPPDTGFETALKMYEMKPEEAMTIPMDLWNQLQHLIQLLQEKVEMLEGQLGKKRKHIPYGPKRKKKP